MGTVARPRKPRRLSAFPYTIDLKGDAMKIKEVLLKAASLLQRKGWCRWALKNSRGSMCAGGALNAALHGDADLWAKDAKINPAIKQILKVVGIKPRLSPVCELVTWNNSVCKSKAEIVSVFRKAAKLS